METADGHARRKLEEMRGGTHQSALEPSTAGKTLGGDISLEKGPSSGRGRVQLLDLPGEVLSLISGYLALPDLLPFLSLHPTLLQLTQSHLSPIRSAITYTLSDIPSSIEYPAVLGKLPLLALYLPPDPIDAGRLFLPLLVRADPRWIVETLHHGRWPESIWQEAFGRRFLPSWKRYKEENDVMAPGMDYGVRDSVARTQKRKDTWKAAFLRVLGKLEHRESGCTHQEAWTRFVTLHRNGSASLNRIYSRQFDPYEIFAELKHQNNFADEPTTVRVVLHLADVRILAVGVLLDRPNMFVNRNAHNVLHPPGLRDLREARLARMERERVQLGALQAGQPGVGRDKGKGRAIGSSLVSPPDSSIQRAKRITAPSRSHRMSEPLIPTSAAARAAVIGSSTGQVIEAATPMPNNSLTRAITINPYPTIDNATPSTDQAPSDTPKTRRSTFSSLFSRTWSTSSGPADSQNTVSAALIPLVASSSGVGSGLGAGSAPVSGSGWLGSMLTQVRSRDSAHRLQADGEDSKRRKSFGRKGSGSSPVIPAAALFGEVGWGGLGSKSRRSSISTGTAGAKSEVPIVETIEAGQAGNAEAGSEGSPGIGGVVELSVQAASFQGADGNLRTQVATGSEGENGPADASNASDEDAADTDVVQNHHLPPQVDLAYPIMQHPQPASSHRFYPNLTPYTHTISETTTEQVPMRETLLEPDRGRTPSSIKDESAQPAESALMDRRALYDEIEDDYAGYLFSQETTADAAEGSGVKLGGAGGAGGDGSGDRDERRFVEWQEGEGRKRWVGPMLIIAQLHTPSQTTAQPPYVPLTSPTEGPNPNLGAKGTYVSLGFEDIDALFPWLTLKGEGAYASSAKRGGMGFAAAGD